MSSWNSFAKRHLLCGRRRFCHARNKRRIKRAVKKEKQNVTREDLLIKGEATRLPQTIIMDGNIMKEAVHELGYSVAWVKEQLKEKGAAVDKVFLGQADSAGHLYLDYYED